MATCNSMTVEVKFREMGEVDLTSSKDCWFAPTEGKKRVIGF